MHIAFDLDGTLIDSVGDLATSASELVTTLGGRPLAESDVALMVGDGAALLVRRALEASGLDPDTPGALDRFLEIYDSHLLDTTDIFEGIDDVLRLASRRATLSVVTNKPLHHTRRILDALELTGFFDAVVGGDGPAGRKPNPAGLLSASAGRRPLMLVGDSPVDWQAAQAAGCAFAWARYGFSARRFDTPPETPYVLEQPVDFAGVLDRFGAMASGA